MVVIRSKYAVMVPPSAATSAAVRHSGRPATTRNDSQPAAQAAPVPIAVEVDRLPITTSVVSMVGATSSAAATVPKARCTVAHIPPTAMAMRTNAIQRVPATPINPSAGRVSTAYPCQ